MNGQHTPGPWTLETVRTQTGICHKIGPFPWKHGHQNHACVYVDYPNHDNRGQFEDELTANAHLIAAAPHMYDVLCDLRSRIKACANLPISTNEVFDSFYAELINDAIAKAKGAA
jgi:hypothetical protein